MQDVLQNLLDLIIVPFLVPFEPSQRIFIPYLLLGGLIAYAVYLRRAKKMGKAEGFLRYLFPKAVYTHPSAKLDYKYFIPNQIILFTFLPLVVFFGSAVGAGVEASLSSVFSSPFQVFESTIPLIVLYTLVIALAADFGVFYAHYLFHRIPFLWHFHKVHHSAEVLTPMTVYRMHPVDQLLTMAIAGITAGIASGIFKFLFISEISGIYIGSVALLTLLFYVGGYNLRHSHIWLHYPKWLAAFLISPAQHQIHHSVDEKHYDRNFGLMFSVWDRLFGTLYNPTHQEDIRYGLKSFHGERHQHHSITEILVTPFTDQFKKNDKKDI